MKLFKKICSVFESSIDIMIFVVAVAMMIIGILQILFRYVFSSALSWSEETIRYLHVWLVTIGGTVCFYHGSFATINLVSDKIEARFKLGGKVLEILRFVFPVIFYGLMLIEGVQICDAYVVKLTAVTRIPMSLVYLCIPLTGVFGLCFSVAKIPDLIKKLKGETK